MLLTETNMRNKDRHQRCWIPHLATTKDRQKQRAPSVSPLQQWMCRSCDVSHHPTDSVTLSARPCCGSEPSPGSSLFSSQPEKQELNETQLNRNLKDFTFLQLCCERKYTIRRLVTDFLALISSLFNSLSFHPYTFDIFLRKLLQLSFNLL